MNIQAPVHNLKPEIIAQYLFNNHFIFVKFIELVNHTFKRKCVMGQV